MNQAEATVLRNMRRKAQQVKEAVHVYPTVEKIVHTLDINEKSVELNSVCTLVAPGQLCFCEPDVEDYTDVGGGTLVIHKRVVWQ